MEVASASYTSIAASTYHSPPRRDTMSSALLGTMYTMRWDVLLVEYGVDGMDQVLEQEHHHFMTTTTLVLLLCTCCTMT